MNAILLPPRKRLRKTPASEITVRPHTNTSSNVPPPLARLHKRHNLSQCIPTEGEKSAPNSGDVDGSAPISGNAGDFDGASPRGVVVKKELTLDIPIVTSGTRLEFRPPESPGRQQAHTDAGYEAPKSGAADNICKICRKALSSKQSVHRHVMLIHRKQKFPCETCEKKFSSKHSLERHVATVHLQLRPFRCEDPNCDKWFGQREVAKTHYKKVHDKARLSGQVIARRLAVGPVHKHD